MATAKQQYTRALRDVANRYGKLERDTIKRSVDLLREMRNRLQLELTSAEGFNEFKLNELTASVDRLIAQYEAQMLALTNGAVNGSARLGALSVTEPLQAAGVGVGFFQPVPSQINAVLDFSAELIRGISNDTRKLINREIRMAALGERSTISAMRAINAQLGIKRGNNTGIAYEGERILRTEMGRVYNLSNQSQMQVTAQQAPELQKQWLATGDSRTRWAHLAAHGQLVGVNEHFDVGGEKLMYPLDPAGSAANTINCLLPGNEVIAPGLRAATRSWFSGRAVELTVTSGNKLSITPNHPVLTPRGWVAAQFLNEGDYVISSRFGQEIARAIDPNNDHVPTAIEQVWSALLVMGEGRKLVSPAMPENFHGDGRFMDGNIDIVTTGGELWRDVDYASLVEHIDKLALRWRLVLQSFLSGFGPQMQLALSTLLPTNGVVGGGGKSAALIHGHSLHPDGVSFANPARFYSGFQQAVPESGPGDTSLSSEFLLRFAGLIAHEQIVKVRNFDFSGHVYNLHTVPELYIGNTVVVHNCRCRMVTVHPEIGPIVGPLDERVDAERQQRGQVVEPAQPAPPRVPTFTTVAEAQGWARANISPNADYSRFSVEFANDLNRQLSELVAGSGVRPASIDWFDNRDVFKLGSVPSGTTRLEFSDNLSRRIVERSALIDKDKIRREIAEFTELGVPDIVEGLRRDLRFNQKLISMPGRNSVIDHEFAHALINDRIYGTGAVSDEWRDFTKSLNSDAKGFLLNSGASRYGATSPNPTEGIAELFAYWRGGGTLPRRLERQMEALFYGELP